MAWGALWIVGSLGVGLVSLIAALLGSAPEPGWIVFPVDGVAVGAGLYWIGRIERRPYRTLGPAAREAYHAWQGARCLLGSLVYVASTRSPRRISNAAAERIRSICRRMGGSPPDPQTLRRLAMTDLERSNELAAAQSPPDVRSTILTASVILGLAEGLDQHVMARLGVVADQLGFGPEDVAAELRAARDAA